MKQNKMDVWPSGIDVFSITVLMLPHRPTQLCAYITMSVNPSM